ncbi:hypothetical protein FHG87_003620 [Trinorchestia longiramus]|nr:hypothetical protein FHG87_003620 [Trinorchestia longiramus]
MSCSKRRVSLSRRHLQKRSSHAEVEQELLPDAVHPHAHHSDNSSIGKSSDALLELDRLGMPRVSSLGESLDKLDHESTDDDRAYLASPSPYRAGTSQASSSTEEAGLLYELHSTGFSGQEVQGRSRSLGSSNCSFDINPQEYYFSISNKSSNSPYSSSRTLSISSEISAFHAYSGVVYPDQLYASPNASCHYVQNNSEVRSVRGNGSSGESGCDTEGTIRAVSDSDDFKQEIGSKIETNGELLESGFTEDFHPSTLSVYEEEAIINIKSSMYDSDSDDTHSMRSGSQVHYSDRNSCQSFSTSYPESQYQNTKTSKYTNSCCSLDEFSRGLQPPKKSNLIRRPHVKASQSPLLKRKDINENENHGLHDKLRINRKDKVIAKDRGEVEIELERPTRNTNFNTEIGCYEQIECVNLRQNANENDGAGLEISEHEREKTSLDFLENFSCVEQPGQGDVMWERSISSVADESVTGDAEVLDTDKEYFNIMENAMNLEMTKNKWAKTKEQILKLLKERLLILKKIIQDKNSQIRQLKTRLKVEQQNSQALADKLKERERPSLPSTVTAEVTVLKRQLTALRQEKTKLRQELMLKEVKLKEASKEIVNKRKEEERWKKVQLQERRRESARESRAIAELKKTVKNMEKWALVFQLHMPLSSSSYHPSATLSTLAQRLHADHRGRERVTLEFCVRFLAYTVFFLFSASCRPSSLDLEVR